MNLSPGSRKKTHLLSSSMALRKVTQGWQERVGSCWIPEDKWNKDLPGVLALEPTTKLNGWLFSRVSISHETKISGRSWYLATPGTSSIRWSMGILQEISNVVDYKKKLSFFCLNPSRFSTFFVKIIKKHISWLTWVPVSLKASTARMAILPL